MEVVYHLKIVETLEPNYVLREHYRRVSINYTLLEKNIWDKSGNRLKARQGWEG